MSKVLYGRSNHHKIEAIFKCFARAHEVCRARPTSGLKDQLPSTKGLLMIAIFDYGAGNLRSVQNTLDAIGAEYELVRDSKGLGSASKIILPGVGHFGQMMRALDELDVRATLTERICAGVPFLGICLGHAGAVSAQRGGAGSAGSDFHGTVKRFPADARVPHMGWNTLDVTKPARLLKGF